MGSGNSTLRCVEKTIDKCGQAASTVLSAVPRTLAAVTKPVPLLGPAVGHVTNVMIKTTNAAINVFTTQVKLPLELLQGKPVLNVLVKQAASFGAAAVTPIAAMLDVGPRAHGRFAKCDFGHRVLIFDTLADEPWLRASWDAAQTASVNRFTHTIRATSWAQVFGELCAIVRRDGQLSEVQFLGHGAPGAAFVGGEQFSIDSLGQTAFQEFSALKPFCTNGTGLWWFRTCQTMNRDEGRAFAKKMRDALGVRIAGHTVLIPDRSNPARQSGLVVLDAGTSDALWEDDGRLGDWVFTTTFATAHLAPMCDFV